jgi:hypothetical protein
MSSISIETNNENQLTVEEFVRYLKIREDLQNFIDNDIKETFGNAENSLNCLTIEVTVKYSIDKKKS